MRRCEGLRPRGRDRRPLRGGDIEAQTGSHLPAWDREAYRIGGNVLNRLALQGLDQAVKRYEPQSKRIYLSMDPAKPEIGLVIGS